MRIALNSKTSGGFKVKKLNNREHIVTHMVSIVGDSVMNGLFYPDAEVTNSFSQLDSLPAPNRHPTVNGQSVSAFHPLAINSNNIGAFVRSPKKSKKIVKNQLWVDVEVANQSEDGQELIRRIKSGEKVGVSTGLKTNIENSAGDHQGLTYNGVARNYQFDHVAILLDEAAAGDHVGTELVYNAEHKEDDTFMCVVDVQNELDTHAIQEKVRDALKSSISGDVYIYIVSLFPESKRVVYEIESKDVAGQLYSRTYSVDQNDNVLLLNDAMPVVKRVQYEPETIITGNHEMNLVEAKQIVADAGLIVLNEADHKALSEKADSVDALNSQIETMKPVVEAHEAAEKATRDTVVNTIIENSEMTADHLNGMSIDALNVLNTSLAGKKKTVDRAAQPGATDVNNSQDEDNRVFDFNV